MAIDRKAAIREYKENPRPMGLFAVRNLETDRLFIGTTADLPSMLRRQRFGLEMGSHMNRALQADWNALGEEAFAFEVLDTLERADDATSDPKDDLAELLEMWRDRLLGEGVELY